MTQNIPSRNPKSKIQVAIGHFSQIAFLLIQKGSELMHHTVYLALSRVCEDKAVLTHM